MRDKRSQRLKRRLMQKSNLKSFLSLYFQTLNFAMKQPKLWPDWIITPNGKLYDRYCEMCQQRCWWVRVSSGQQMVRAAEATADSEFYLNHNKTTKPSTFFSKSCSSVLNGKICRMTHSSRPKTQLEKPGWGQRLSFTQTPLMTRRLSNSVQSLKETVQSSCTLLESDINSN